MVAASPLSSSATMATMVVLVNLAAVIEPPAVVTGLDTIAWTEAISPQRKRAWSTAWQPTIPITPVGDRSGAAGSVRHSWE
jgi:hypothetical protein